MKRIFDYLNIPPQKRINLQEIRLCINKPIILYSKNKSDIINRLITKKDLEHIFTLMCNYSVYSKQNEIKQGFITLKGGNRAGICGTAVYGKDGIINIRDISAVNIRIVGEYIGCADKLLSQIEVKKGLLLCGAPCSGKTTLLRDIARKLSERHKLSLIDTRGEIAASYLGECQCDVGYSFVLDGYSKTDGFDHAVRCLSPDFIVCDELGSAEDITSVQNAINSGTSVIASAHCSDKDELMSKPYLRDIAAYFSNIAFLHNRENVGQLRELVSGNELLS